MTTGDRTNSELMAAPELECRASAVINGGFVGWAPETPPNPQNRTALIDGWTVEYSDRTAWTNVAFTAAESVLARRGCRVSIQAPIKWARLCSPVRLPDDSHATAELSLRGLRLVASNGNINLDWVGLLTVNDRGKRVLAQSLISSPLLTNEPSNLASEHELRRAIQSAQAKELLLALQFSGGPGAIEFEAISLIFHLGRKIRSPSFVSAPADRGQSQISMPDYGTAPVVSAGRIAAAAAGILGSAHRAPRTDLAALAGSRYDVAIPDNTPSASPLQTKMGEFVVPARASADSAAEFSLFSRNSAAKSAERITLSHRSEITPDIFVEFGGGSKMPQGVCTFPSSGQVAARIDFSAVKQFARLFLRVPSKRVVEHEYVLLKGKIRSADERTFKVTIGWVDKAAQKNSWVWRAGRRCQLEVGTEWAEFWCTWPSPDSSSAEKPDYLLCHVDGTPVIEVADLQLARLPLDPTILDRVPNFASISPANLDSWQPDVIVLPGEHAAGTLYYTVVHSISSHLRPTVWQGLNWSGIKAEPCAVRVRDLGAHLLTVEAAAPAPAGTLVLVGGSGAEPVVISLGHHGGHKLNAKILRASFEAGRLNVEAEFISERPEMLDGLSVELEAGGLVLQKGTVARTSDRQGRPPSVVLATVCTARTAGRPLRLVIPALGMAFDVGPLAADTAPASEVAPELLPVAEFVEGTFEDVRLTPNGVLAATGWARDPSKPGQAVIVDVFVDDMPIATGRALGRRKDVSAKKGGSDVAGFTVELPPNFCKGQTISISARPRTRRGALNSATREVRLAPFGYTCSMKEVELKPRIMRPASNFLNKTCAAIVLTQDGSAVLKDFLESIEHFEERTFSRIVIIDHESMDDTARVISTFQPRLPITHIVRPRNSSFSESNNYGASLCNEDVIFFLNNDLILTSPIINEMARFLSAEVGVVGVKLLDPPAPGRRVSINAPQHVAIHFDPSTLGGIRPFESRILTDCLAANINAVQVPAATAALIALERKHFEALGGFDERYFYGWEDIDLCLRSLSSGKVNVSVNSSSAIHIRAHSRRQMPSSLSEKRGMNQKHFNETWAYALRRSLRSAQAYMSDFWTGRKVHFGYVVSEYGPDATAGDYMTALDFSRAAERIAPVRSYFFKKSEIVDATDIDFLIVMTDDFDARKIINLSTTSTVVAWARNWFHRWVSRPWRERFDVWLASSDRARLYMEEELGRSVALLRIGTDEQRFANGGAFNPELVSDAVFTGHFWGSPRDVLSMVEDARGMNIRFYGKGWDEIPAAVPFWGGVLPYERIADVYKSTKVVIDDSNFATATWASLNSRVFDALASGALVLTNNTFGVAEVFPDVLPTYSDKQELLSKLSYYVTNEEQRRSVVSKARAAVLERHTYRTRAQEFLAIVRHREVTGFRVAIKIACPKMERADGWGDWYFAGSLRRELERLGHSVRIDCLEDWYGAHTASDDICLVIRGLECYSPRRGQINLLWIISHPDKVSVQEINGYDACFAASRKIVDAFQELASCPLAVLPQCTDAGIFYPSELGSAHSSNGPVVFVGNSRGVARAVVQAAAASASESAAGFELHVHGGGWAGLLPEEFVKSQLVQNDDLGEVYRGASVVLNDHWEDMRRWGIVSNRVFDAVACGRPVISDDCGEILDLFPDTVILLKHGREFKDAYNEAMEVAGQRAKLQSAAERVLAEHTFAKRAEFFDHFLRKLDSERNVLRDRRFAVECSKS